MTQVIESLSDIAAQFDAIVLDQWGVLHDGSTPYPFAVDTLRDLNAAGVRLAVLSNSGKRSASNAKRIATMGFGDIAFEVVMTSGEALWQDIAERRERSRRIFAIERSEGDAAAWADGLDIELVDQVSKADALLLMGLPDGADPKTFAPILADAAHLGLAVMCTNPDRASPRAGGATVVSPGALAHAHLDAGHPVRFYGKPHVPVFNAVQRALGLKNRSRLLMVGDSLEHDIAGGHYAGWSTLLVRSGLHASAFTDGANITQAIAALAANEGAPMPTYSLEQLR